MKLAVLCENTARDPALTPEHGLSLLLETAGRVILLDMGQSDAFAKNADRMGLSLADVDLAVLSHGHYDHGGGIPAFFARNAHAPLYLSDKAFGAHYHGERYIGIDPSLAEHPRLRPIGKDTPLFSGVSVLSSALRAPKHPIDASGLSVREGNTHKPEQFLHEQYLLVEEEGKRILFSGCSHRGVRNLLAWFSPDVLVGGLHLSGLDPSNAADARALDAVAEAMERSGARFLTGHCTGERAYAYLKERLGERIEAFSTGDCLSL